MTTPATAHRSELGSTEIKISGSRLVSRTFADVSPEILLEAMARVDAYSRAAGVQPQQQPLTARFRKRLAGVR